LELKWRANCWEPIGIFELRVNWEQKHKNTGKFKFHGDSHTSLERIKHKFGIYSRKSNKKCRREISTEKE
jgi:hypothetical protein